MTPNDGQVVGVTTVVDNGPASLRWNLVVLGDGYQPAELDQYAADVDNFVTVLQATPPYYELWGAINVHRIDVESVDSGADDPSECPGGTGQTARTYFDATFCSLWNGTRLDRLLTVDDALAEGTARQWVPEMHQALVIVNSSKYGGSGGPVAVCSTHAVAPQIAIHEIGHSAFDLADEYENGGSAHGLPEPHQPNITRNPDRATIKWGHLIAPSTPMPTSRYYDCTDAPTSPPPSTGIGAYEGAGYYHCDMYRPLQACYMRDYSPFCDVCAEVIRETLEPFMPMPGDPMCEIEPDEIADKIRGAGAVSFRGWLGRTDDETCYLVTEPWGEEELQIKCDDIVCQLSGSGQPGGYSVVWVKGDAMIAKCRFAKARRFAEIETDPKDPEHRDPPPRYPRH
jgi:hypothetical protein